MHEKILHSILPLVLLLVPVATLGQQPQNTASTQAQHTQISVNVYEFDFVDRQPQFPGGDNAMIRFINHERRYPKEAYQEGIEGRVLCVCGGMKAALFPIYQLSEGWRSL